MGEVFAGRYELVDPIGRGGAGEVWRAWDQRRGRYVAAKVLQQSDAHALLRFVREQAVRIDHPHVLAPASWAADDDKVLFTMDLVAGGSLSHLVGDYGPLPPRYVCVLLDQLLAGLHAVHSEGIVHRDIKPANILLEATGTGTPHVRLSDFGIAVRKGEPRLTEAHFVVGTPGYFAPEQMLGADPDFPADLYAVGLVALYLLGGRRPDAQAITERFLDEGTPAAPDGVPAPLWQVLAALLQPDPQARFRTATGARKALAGAVELLPEPPAGEEPVEIFDQVGPLPEGFGPAGPLKARDAAEAVAAAPPAPPVQPAPHAPSAPPVQPAPHAPSAPPAQDAIRPPAPPLAGPPTPTPTPTPPTAQPQQPAAPYGPPPAADYPLAPAHVPTRADAPAPAAAPPVPVPVPAPVPQPAAPAVPPAHDPGAPAPQRRTGPPRGVVVPVLLLALVCFVLGAVALATA
jgi:serine/threonine protein kinase